MRPLLKAHTTKVKRSNKTESKRAIRSFGPHTESRTFLSRYYKNKQTKQNLKKQNESSGTHYVAKPKAAERFSFAFAGRDKNHGAEEAYSSNCLFVHLSNCHNCRLRSTSASRNFALPVEP